MGRTVSTPRSSACGPSPQASLWCALSADGLSVCPAVGAAGERTGVARHGVLQLLEQGRGDDTHARHCDGPGVAELAGVQHDRQGFHFRVVVARLRQASGLSARTAPAQGRPRTRSRPARTSSFPCCGRAGRPAEREETRFGPGRGPGAAQGWDDSCGMCGPGGPGGVRNKHSCPRDRSPARAGHEAVGPSKRRPDYWDAPCGTRFNSPFSVRDLAR